MGLADLRVQLTQVLNSKEKLSDERLIAFAQRKYWVYRAIAAGQATGAILDGMIESEKDLGVVRQLAFNRSATPAQLSRIAELWIPNLEALEDDPNDALGDIRYAIATSKQCPPELKARIAPGWKI